MLLNGLNFAMSLIQPAGFFSVFPSLCLLFCFFTSQAVLAAPPINRTLKFPADPPSFGITTTNAFGDLAFLDPLGFATPPGETNRLFVVEQGGVVSVITNLAAPSRTVFLNLSGRILGGRPSDERGLLGLAFHPGYSSNRMFFVYYTLRTSTPAGTGTHQRVSRFLASETDPNTALPASETPLITQFDDYSNHNGGDLHFGPDGYLYISLGDEGNQNDAGNNSQRIDRDFFSGILRVDVDEKPGNLLPNPHPAVNGNYRVPADNPFVGAAAFNGRAVNPTAVRTEFWAVGLRNPWRFSFDPANGQLYAGDVGGDRTEEVNLIVRGGNYGWAFREGTGSGPKSTQAPAGFVSIPPLVQYGHGTGTNQGNSITGGRVYRGSRIAQLHGAYIYADYVSGNVWETRFDGTNATAPRLLFKEFFISAFGVDPRNGDLLIANQQQDRIKRIIYNPATTGGSTLPPTLAATGAFRDLATLTPETGLVPYTLNVPFWSDHAIKRRWFALTRDEGRIGFSVDGGWSFPEGMVWVKHFDLELERGNPATSRRLETRFLVRNRSGVYGLTYRWDSAQTNATLVAEEGADESIEIRENGFARIQQWRYPSRAECLACHTSTGGYALGFNTSQLNCDAPAAASEVVASGNQIQRWNDGGFFGATNAAASRVNLLPALVPARDTNASLALRVKSFLAANCSQCHQPGGPALGTWDARFQSPLSESDIIDGNLHNSFGSADARVIAPGSISRSALLQRILATGPTRMPPIGSTELNREAIALLTEWIEQDLPRAQSYELWSARLFGSAAGSGPNEDPDLDGNLNQLEYLVGGDPKTPDDRVGLKARVVGDVLQLEFNRAPGLDYEIQTSATPAAPDSWTLLDHPANRPFSSSNSGVESLQIPWDGAGQRYFRLRIGSYP